MIRVGDRVKVKTAKELLRSGWTYRTAFDLNDRLYHPQSPLLFMKDMKQFCGLGGVVVDICQALLEVQYLIIDNPKLQNTPRRFTEQMLKPWKIKGEG